MKKSILLLIVFTLFMGAYMYAQSYTLTFRDFGGTTRTLIDAEDPTYPQSPPAEDRWLIQVYKDGGNGIIDPLNAAGDIVGDDIMLATNANTVQYLAFLSATAWQSQAIQCQSGTEIQEGSQIYLRIFNNHDRLLATKSVTFGALYTVGASNFTAVLPTNFTWSTWVSHAGPPPTYTLTVLSTPLESEGAAIWRNGVDTGQVTPYTFDPGEAGTYTLVKENWTWVPMEHIVPELMENTTISFAGTFVPPITPPLEPVYLAPANGSTVSYAGVNLEWEDGTPPPPMRNSASRSRQADPNRDPATDYDVWFGPVGSLVLVSAGQMGTTYATGALDPATAYAWQIIANNSAGSTPGAIWGFETDEAPPVYWPVTITSVPDGQPIYVGGVDSGEVTPFTFQMLEGTSATYSIYNPLYTWFPEDWTTGPVMGPMSQEFVGTLVPVFWPVTITSVPDGQPIYVGGVDSGEVTPFTFQMLEGTSATYSIYNPLYTWVPEEWFTGPVMGAMSQEFVGTLVPVFWPVTITSVPDVQPIYVGGVDSGEVTPFTFQMLEGTSATYSIYNPLYTWMPEEWFTGPVMGAMSQEFVGTEIPVVTAPVLTWPGDDSFNLPYGIVILYWDVDNMPMGSYFNVYLDTFTPPTTLVYSGTAMSYDPGILMPLTTYWWYVELVTPDKAVYPSEIFEFMTSDQLLPVELSNFTATVTSELFVNLKWTTESETDALGYNVYRSSTNSSNNAEKVNLSIIPATNTSMTHTYSFVDDTEGLAPNNTYYYWLENVDLSGMADLHGPVNVTITGTVTPILPEISVLNNAYPNPFRLGGVANIRVNIKANETGTVTIYNLLGQAVKTYNKLQPGEHTLTWDAQGCASGIYFYKLSTPSTNVTKKLVIVN